MGETPITPSHDAAEALPDLRRPRPFGTPSIATVGALTAAAGAGLYLFNRLYTATFLQSFGLGVGVVPVSYSDAVADGFQSFVPNVLAFWAPIAAVILVYVVWRTAEIFLGRRAPRPARPDRTRSPSFVGAGLRRIREDPGHELRMLISLAAIVSPVVVVIGALLVALPADLAARREVGAFRDATSGGCRRCAVYELDTGSVRGLAIGSTPERLYVLDARGYVMPVKMDRIRSIRPPRLSGDVDPDLGKEIRPPCPEAPRSERP